MTAAALPKCAGRTSKWTMACHRGRPGVRNSTLSHHRPAIVNLIGTPNPESCAVPETTAGGKRIGMSTMSHSTDALAHGPRIAARSTGSVSSMSKRVGSPARGGEGAKQTCARRPVTVPRQSTPAGASIATSMAKTSSAQIAGRTLPKGGPEIAGDVVSGCCRMSPLRQHLISLLRGSNYRVSHRTSASVIVRTLPP